jgi:plastocyanin
VFKALFPALSACLIALVLAACGSSSSSSSAKSTPAASATVQTVTTPAPAAGAGRSALAVAANPQGRLKFEPSSLSAKAGKVTIAFTNSAPLQHNLTIQQGSGTNGAILGNTPTFAGGTKTITTNLTPGTYVFYCSVAGHRAAGMQGTVTVH